MHAGRVNELVYRVNSSLNLERQAVHRQLEQLGEAEVQLRDEQLILNREKAELDKEFRALKEARAVFEDDVKREWVLPDSDRRVCINVGGQMFETTAKVLCRDRFSLLAAICSKQCSTPKDSDGVYFIDRDWWIFRHILAFLRNKSLPNSPTLLRELYVESAAYRLGSLRAAIERKFAEKYSPRRALTAGQLERRDRVVKQAAVLARSQNPMNASNALMGGTQRAMSTLAAGADALQWMNPSAHMSEAQALAESSIGAGVSAYPGGVGSGLPPAGMMGPGASMGMGMGMNMGMGMGPGMGGAGMGGGMLPGADLRASGAFAGSGYGMYPGQMGRSRGVAGGYGRRSNTLGTMLGFNGGYGQRRLAARELPDPFEFTRGGDYLGGGYSADAHALPDEFGFTRGRGGRYSDNDYAYGAGDYPVF